jgi:hypothetical protein
MYVVFSFYFFGRPLRRVTGGWWRMMPSPSHGVFVFAQKQQEPLGDWAVRAVLLLFFVDSPF